MLKNTQTDQQRRGNRNLPSERLPTLTVNQERHAKDIQTNDSQNHQNGASIANRVSEGARLFTD